MLYQLQWQNPRNPSERELVAQNEFPTDRAGAEACHAWMREVIERRKDECPKDWGPMLCTEESNYFYLAVPGSTRIIAGGDGATLAEQ